MSDAPNTLAIIILTLNEEKNLPACMASLNGLSGRIFVVDSGSSDRTIQIAEEAGATVVRHAFGGYGTQRNWALRELPFSCEWVLNLDADERLTPELAVEIAFVLANPPLGVEGFMLRRRTVFMGRWIRYGGHYPSHQLRLFRRAAGECEDRMYDQHFVVRGNVATLHHDYIDVVASELSTWSLRHVRWAGAEAGELMRTDEIQGARVAPSLTGDQIAKNAGFARKFMAGFLSSFAR